MKTFDEMTQAMIDADRQAGHICEDAPVYGRYEVLARAALMAMRRKVAGTACLSVIDSIMRGSS